MSRKVRTPNFRGRRAVVLHRPHVTVEAVLRQLERLGMSAVARWPELEEGDLAADVILFDADMGHDGQFPWEAGAAPMPMIALVGSEAPGRLEWMLTHGICAHMLKPVTSGGVYSGLVVAFHAFAERRARLDEVADLRARLRRRPQVARALARVMAARGLAEDDAYKVLRTEAMSRRQTIEDYCEALLAAPDETAGRAGSCGS